MVSGCFDDADMSTISRNAKRGGCWISLSALRYGV
jgi:hypothetical protein